MTEDTVMVERNRAARRMEADSLLWQVWDEYRELTEDGKELVTDDLLSIGGWYLDSTIEQYRRGIGPGNLAGYARCLKIQKEQGR